MSEVSNKRFVHFNGTKEEFIAGGYPSIYTDSIVFINGDGNEYNNAIYTHGEYYGYTKDSLNNIIGLGEIFTEVSVIGDSISTYENWIPNGYNNYYPLTVDDKTVNSVTQTYWHKLIYNKMYNAYLGVNNSYSGSTITKITDDSSTRADFCFRFINEGLGNPDVIIIHGGVNDCTPKSDGTYRANLYNGATGMAPSTAPTKAYLEGLCNSANQISTYDAAVNTLPDNYFVDAYIKLLTLIRIKYPQAKVVSIISEWLTKRTVDALKIILNHFNRTYGYNYINFWESEGYKSSTNITKISSAHPDVNGFNYIANKIYDTLSSYLNKSSVIKYDVPMTYSEGEYSIINKHSGSISSGKYAIAIGADNIFGEASPAEGDKLEYCTASGYASHAEGSAHALGAYSHAEGGGNTDVTEEGYHVVSTAEGECSHAEGTHTYAYGGASHAEGNRTKAIGAHSHAEGRRTIASGSGSHAEGKETTASGLTSHAEGEGVEAYGEASHAEGYITKSFGKYSHAEGNETNASGTDSHAEGKLTIAQGANSHAEGYNTLASGVYGHSEGNSTVASGEASHAEGEGVEASGKSSHAEGNETKAIGTDSHAEGKGTKANGSRSHAEGFNTIAFGGSSHAEGALTAANGDYSHASGIGTIASGTAEFVCGKYNNPVEYSQFSVGIGTESEKCNGINVLKSGTYIKGIGGYNGVSVENSITIQDVIGNIEITERTLATNALSLSIYPNRITYYEYNKSSSGSVNVSFNKRDQQIGPYSLIINTKRSIDLNFTVTVKWLNGVTPSDIITEEGIYEISIIKVEGLYLGSIGKFM